MTMSWKSCVKYNDLESRVFLTKEVIMFKEILIDLVAVGSLFVLATIALIIL